MTEDDIKTIIKRRLKKFGDKLDDDDMADLMIPAKADVGVTDVDMSALTGWELAWVIDRGIRHGLATLINNWNLIVNVLDCELGEVKRAILSWIEHLDERWDKERGTKALVAGRYVDTGQAYSADVLHDYQIDEMTGWDTTDYKYYTYLNYDIINDIYFHNETD